MSRTSVRTLLSPAVVIGALLAGCEEELQSLADVECVASTEEATSDKDFSVFERAYTLGESTGFDGMVIDSPRPANLDAGSRWTIRTVDVLVVRPLGGQLAELSDSIDLTVQLWEGDDPNAPRAGRWELKKTVDVASLDWQPHAGRTVLDMGPMEDCEESECSDISDDPVCRTYETEESATVYRCELGGLVETAWLSFDFSTDELLGKENLEASQFTIGVRWTTPYWPLVAASDYTKSCYLNWHATDEVDSKPRRLSDDPDKTLCNWPLVRLTGQTIASGESCRRTQ